MSRTISPSPTGLFRVNDEGGASEIATGRRHNRSGIGIRSFFPVGGNSCSLPTESQTSAAYIWALSIQ